MFQIFQVYSESCYLNVMQEKSCEKQITNPVLQKDFKVNKNFNKVLVIIIS